MAEKKAKAKKVATKPEAPLAGLDDLGSGNVTPFVEVPLPPLDTSVLATSADFEEKLGDFARLTVDGVDATFEAPPEPLPAGYTADHVGAEEPVCTDPFVIADVARMEPDAAIVEMLTAPLDQVLADYPFTDPKAAEVMTHLANYMALVEADLAKTAAVPDPCMTSDGCGIIVDDPPPIRWHRTDTLSSCPLGFTAYIREGVWAVQVQGRDLGTVRSRDEGEARIARS